MTSPFLPGDPQPESAVTLSGVLAGRYEIQRQIGEGGMATVYLARDLNRDVLVAIKAPKPELVMQLGRERFLREIQITTKLQHPHIVAVLDAGTEQGVPFYVMPYIEGETLDQRIRRGGPLPVDEAITLATEILDGLAYAHSLGFVHRDVKPSNIMLSNGHAQLADFGIAKVVEHTENRKLTESGFALGTAEYMSPEQAAGEAHLDGRSDLYSLGCVLYQMCAGAPPFSAPTARAVMAKHFVDPVPSIRTVRDTVPPKLEAAIFTALAKMPVDRFANAEAFKAALKDPTLRDATAVTAGPAVARRASRLRKAAIIGGTLVAGFGAFTTWRARAASEGPLDPNRVMVFPFVAAEGLGASKSLGEDVATIIGNALDAADPLRWVDGWALMDEASRSDIRSFTHDKARRLARTRRCATFLEGRVTRHSSDSIAVTLSLWDAQADTLLATESANGAAAEPWHQGLRATSRVLPKLIRGSSQQLGADWQDRIPGAVANFLLGEAAYRRVRMTQALDHFRRAVALDSTFALAAVRGAQAASWAHRGSVADTLVRLALAKPLPPRYREFALGVAAYLDGWADSAAMHLNAAIAADSDMTAAWMQLGEVYAHKLPLAGNTDSLSELAFARARRLDSAAVGAIYHPLQYRLLRGDTAAAAPLMARLLAAAPDSDVREDVSIMDACVRQGAAAVPWQRLVTTAPLRTLYAAGKLSTSNYTNCARRAFEMLVAVDTAAIDEAADRRVTAMIGLQALALQRGDTVGAAASIEEMFARTNSGRSLYLLAAPYTPSFMKPAASVAADDAAKYGQGYLTCPFPRRLWELGAFELHRGNVQVAADVAAELQKRDTGPDARYARELGAGLSAMVKAARGDSAGAERALRALLERSAEPKDLLWDELFPHAAERLLLAQLLFARRAYAEAIDVATVFDSREPLIFAQFRPASLELRARAAAALGNSAAESH